MSIAESVDIDAQLLGLELMDLRQYRHTWVKGTIGLGSVSETRVVQDARTSGGRRFTGCSEFFRETTSCRTSLARFSKASTCEACHQWWGSRFGSWDRTSAVNVATRVRDIGGIADRTRPHSIKSFMFSAPMSCSMESSRAASDAIMIGTSK